MKPQTFTIGLISDTHGVLRDGAVAQLAGVDHIIHAGDIGNPDILDRLGRLAPVSAVRGNNDTGAWADEIPETLRLSWGGVAVYVVHRIQDAPKGAAAAGIDVIVSGHSHRPLVTEEAGVLKVNPGAAGPRRFSLPVTVARLVITSGKVRATIVPVDLSSPND